MTLSRQSSNEFLFQQLDVAAETDPRFHHLRSSQARAKVRGIWDRHQVAPNCFTYATPDFVIAAEVTPANREIHISLFAGDFVKAACFLYARFPRTRALSWYRFGGFKRHPAQKWVKRLRLDDTAPST